MEDIEGDGGAIESNYSVRHAPGNPPDVSRFEDLRGAADGELEPARDEVTHLFMRMGMLGDDATGLEVDDGEHETPAGGDPQVDAWEKGEVVAVAGSDEVPIGVIDRSIGHRISVLGNIERRPIVPKR